MTTRQPPGVSTRRTGVRWLIIGLAFLGTAINYIDRANLSVAKSKMSSELGLNDTEMGLIMSGFFWTYAFFQLPAGWVVDRLGPRVTYTFACTWWSVFTVLTSLGRGLWSLMTCRWLLGMGEAAAYPTNAKVAAEWFPERERALASAIFDGGSRVGTALALPIVTRIIGGFGWRRSFIITGLLGILWSAVWLLFYRVPRRHPWASEAEVEYIERGGGREADPEEAAAAQAAIPWIRLFRYRTVIGMALGFFCLNYVIYFFITWFPTYLEEARGMSLQQLGTAGMIPPLVGTVGGWLGGIVSDTLVRRGVSLTLARKLPIVLGMACSSAIALAAVAPTVIAAMAWLSVSFAGLAFAGASVWSLPADIAPTPAHVGSIGGIQNWASNLAGIVMPPLVGWMLDLSHHNYVIPLVIAGGVGIVGALVYWFVVGPIRPLAGPPVAGQEWRPASP